MQPLASAEHRQILQLENLDDRIRDQHFWSQLYLDSCNFLERRSLRENLRELHLQRHQLLAQLHVRLP